MRGLNVAPFAFDDNPIPMYVFDKETMSMRAVNARALSIYGYNKEEFLSLTLHDLIQNTLGVERPFRLPYPTDTSYRIEEHLTRNGTRLTMKIREKDVFSSGTYFRFTTVEPIGDERRELARLRTLAHKDLLTGLANRTLLDEKGTQALDMAESNNAKLAILFVELDRYKQVNTWYGQTIGDECLKLLGLRLTRRLRGMDVVARTGGVSFTIVLAEVESIESARNVSNSLLESISRPLQVRSHSICLSASIGVAVYPDHGLTFEELQRIARASARAATRGGGNKAVLAKVDQVAAPVGPPQLEAVLEEALHRGAFQQYYQLQYAANGRLRGMEALLRLPRPEGGFISPETFIPVAEETGLIYPIGSWVLEQACMQLKEWNRSGVEPLRVAVNISPIQLLRPGFAITVFDVLQKWNVDPAWLELEITERVMLNFDDAAKSMRPLHERGIRFAVDDFGTGYSSLQHLNRLPISTVKIDRSFVSRLCDENGSQRIVEGIVSMGHSLNMDVIAEGVETEGQRVVLENLGVDGMQGYLLARPAPVDRVSELVWAARTNQVDGAVRC